MPHNLTADDCVRVFHATLAAGDPQGVHAALTLLATRDPHRAQHLLDELRAALAIAADPDAAAAINRVLLPEEVHRLHIDPGTAAALRPAFRAELNPEPGPPPAARDDDLTGAAADTMDDLAELIDDWDQSREGWRAIRSKAYDLWATGVDDGRRETAGDVAQLRAALESVRECMVYSSNDWGAAADFAWLWAILVGGDDDAGNNLSADAVAARYAAGWGLSPARRARLVQHRTAIAAATGRGPRG